MYCSNCGRQIPDNAAVCLCCGAAAPKKTPADTGGAGWWWIGFLVPLAGLLIWITCGDTQPNRAKKAGRGALVSVIVQVALSVLLVTFWFVLIVVLAGML